MEQADDADTLRFGIGATCLLDEVVERNVAQILLQVAHLVGAGCKNAGDGKPLGKHMAA